MARRKDGRPNTVPLFTMLDPLPYSEHPAGLGSPRWAVNFDGNFYFKPRTGYSQNIEDYG